MHVLFVHPNFPAQFGHLAARLVSERGWQCTFATVNAPAPSVAGIELVNARPAGGATVSNHFCSRTFENTVWHCDAFHNALHARPDIRPDLVVGHSGFGTTLFLRELYGATPIINLFEFFYRPGAADCDMSFRSDLGWPVPKEKFLRARCRNAMILLDLDNCDAGYCPTPYQMSCFPTEYRHKLRVVFDGVDRAVYHGHDDALRPATASRAVRSFGPIELPAGAKLVTYVSRGFESMRGFDLFLRAANRILTHVPDAYVVAVGSDKVAYGGDEDYLPTGTTFKSFALLKHPTPDPSRLLFPGRLAPEVLAQLLAASDVHIYLTVPFVLSWSLIDAMSCGAVVVAGDTPPVRDAIADGHTGLLADFFNPDELADKAIGVLNDLPGSRRIGRAAEAAIDRDWSLDAVFPRFLDLFDSVAHR